MDCGSLWFIDVHFLSFCCVTCGSKSRSSAVSGAILLQCCWCCGCSRSRLHGSPIETHSFDVEDHLQELYSVILCISNDSNV